MEQFSLTEYLKNPTRPLVTRDGNSVRIICTDRNYKEYPIVALAQIYGMERMCGYTEDGMYLSGTPTSMDLFFAPEPKAKKVGWMNVCKYGDYGDDKHFTIVGNVVFPTREEALKCKSEYSVDTIQIRWEE